MTIDRSVHVFDQAVRREFAFLKATDRLGDLYDRAIGFDGGALIAICELHADDDVLIADLARWRMTHQDAFPSRFPVTQDGTARWLRHSVLDVADRILFLVCDRHGRRVGHLGFLRLEGEQQSLEVDNVVRGETGQPGLMTAALERLLSWGQEMFGPREIALRVLSDNGRAISFYERSGFVAQASSDLHAEQDGDAIRLRPTRDGETVDARFLRMAYLVPRIDTSGEEILTAGPTISSREISYAADAVRTGWNHHHSDYLDRFSRSFAEYIGVRHALPTSSCTGALHLSLMALGIGAGDEVIVPDLTWVATANAVAYTGATPVFADVQDDSWCIDVDSVRSLITPRTRAIMPVHLYGHPSEMDAVMALAADHGLHVVEDAAPSIGAEVAGRRTGSFGVASAFSFQGAKLLVTGEGGMLVTDSDEFYERARYLWNLGHEGNFWIGALSYKYRMSNVQAAVGLAQLERADEQIEFKRRIFSWYEEELAGLPGIELNREAAWARSIYWMTSIRVRRASGITRDGLRERLKSQNIDTRPVFPPISTYPMWSHRQSPSPVAERIGAEGINLPSGVKLTRGQVARVGAAVRRAVLSDGLALAA